MSMHSVPSWKQVMGDLPAQRSQPGNRSTVERVDDAIREAIRTNQLDTAVAGPVTGVLLRLMTHVEQTGTLDLTLHVPGCDTLEAFTQFQGLFAPYGPNSKPIEKSVLPQEASSRLDYPVVVEALRKIGATAPLDLAAAARVPRSPPEALQDLKPVTVGEGPLVIRGELPEEVPEPVARRLDFAGLESPEQDISRVDERTPEASGFNSFIAADPDLSFLDDSKFEHPKAERPKPAEHAGHAAVFGQWVDGIKNHGRLNLQGCRNEHALREQLLQFTKSPVFRNLPAGAIRSVRMPDWFVSTRSAPETVTPYMALPPSVTRHLVRLKHGGDYVSTQRAPKSVNDEERESMVRRLKDSQPIDNQVPLEDVPPLRSLQRARLGQMLVEIRSVWFPWTRSAPKTVTPDMALPPSDTKHLVRLKHGGDYVSTQRAPKSVNEEERESMVRRLKESQPVDNQRPLEEVPPLRSLHRARLDPGVTIAKLLVEIGATVIVKTPRETMSELDLRGLGHLRVEIDEDRPRRMPLRVLLDFPPAVDAGPKTPSTPFKRLVDRIGIAVISAVQGGDQIITPEYLALPGNSPPGARDMRDVLNHTGLLTDLQRLKKQDRTLKFDEEMVFDAFVETVLHAPTGSKSGGKIELTVDLTKFEGFTREASGFNDKRVRDLFKEYVRKACGGEIAGFDLPRYLSPDALPKSQQPKAQPESKQQRGNDAQQAGAQAHREALFGGLLTGLRHTGNLDLRGCSSPLELEKFLTSPQVGAIPQVAVRSVRLPDWLAKISPAVGASLKKLGSPVVVVSTPPDSEPVLNLSGLGDLHVRIEPDLTRRSALRVIADPLQNLTSDIPGTTRAGAPRPDALKAAVAKLFSQVRRIANDQHFKINELMLEAMFVQTVSSAHNGREGQLVNFETGRARAVKGYENEGLVVDLRKFPGGSTQASGMDHPEVANAFRQCAKDLTKREVNGVLCPSYVTGLAPGIGHLLANTKTQAFVVVSPPPGTNAKLNCLALGPQVNIQIRDCAARYSPFTLQVPVGSVVVPEGRFPVEGAPFVVRGKNGTAQPLAYPAQKEAIRYPNGLLVPWPPAEPKPGSVEASAELFHAAFAPLFTVPDRKTEMPFAPPSLAKDPWADPARPDARAWEQITKSPVWTELRVKDIARSRGVEIPGNSQYSAFMEWAAVDAQASPEQAFGKFQAAAEQIVGGAESKAESKAESPAGVPDEIQWQIGELLHRGPQAFDRAAATSLLWLGVESQYPVPRQEVLQREEQLARFLGFLDDPRIADPKQGAPLLASALHLLKPAASRAIDEGHRAQRFIEQAVNKSPWKNAGMLRQLDVLGISASKYGQENAMAVETIGAFIFDLQAHEQTFATYMRLCDHFLAGDPPVVNISSAVRALVGAVATEESYDREQAMAALSEVVSDVFRNSAMPEVTPEKQEPLQLLAALVPQARAEGRLGGVRAHAVAVLLGPDAEPESVLGPIGQLNKEALAFLRSEGARASHPFAPPPLDDEPQAQADPVAIVPPPIPLDDGPQVEADSKAPQGPASATVSQIRRPVDPKPSILEPDHRFWGPYGEQPPNWWKPIATEINRAERETSGVFLKKTEPVKAFHDFRNLWRDKLHYANPWTRRSPDAGLLKVVLLTAPVEPLLSKELNDEITDATEDESTTPDILSLLVLKVVWELAKRADPSVPQPLWDWRSSSQGEEAAPTRRLESKGASAAQPVAAAAKSFDEEALAWCQDRWDEDGGSILMKARNHGHQNHQFKNVHARFLDFVDAVDKLEKNKVFRDPTRTQELKAILKKVRVLASASLRGEIDDLDKMPIIPKDRQVNVLNRCRYELSYLVVSSPEVVAELQIEAAAALRDPEGALPPLAVERPTWM